MENGVESSSTSTSVFQEQHQQQDLCMNDLPKKRSKNLDTLHLYIEHQKTLLDRLNSQLSYLQELDEAAVVEDPLGIFYHISDLSRGEVDVGKDLGKLESLVGDVLFSNRDAEGGKDAVLTSLDWDLFPRETSYNVTSLRDVPQSLRLSRCPTVFLPHDPTPPARRLSSVSSSTSSNRHASHSLSHPSCPSPYPPPKVSPLLSLVRQERARIVDPVLVQHSAFLATLPPDTDDEETCADSPVNGRRKSKHSYNASVAAAIRPRGPGGVFVRRSAADSSVGSATASPVVQTPPLPGLAQNMSLSTRSKRVRRQSSRARALKEMNSTSSRTKVAVPPVTALRRSSRSASVMSASALVKETKLTIRIPPRPHDNSLDAAHHQFSTKSFATTMSFAGTPGPARFFADRNTRSPTSSAFTQDRSTSVYAGSAFDDDCPMTDMDSSEGEQVKDEPFSDVEFEDSPPPDCSLAHSGVLGHPAVGGKTRAMAMKSPYSHEDFSKPLQNGKKKKRTETFKQTWSVEEQHHLEKLLVDFPDGVQQRWAKISKAMGGHRSARQVASRVQKYFLKLQKYGVDVR